MRDTPLGRSSLTATVLADVTLDRAVEHGASHAAFRLHEIRTGQLLLRDAMPHGSNDTTRVGMAVHVSIAGADGFAATTALTRRAAVATADRAATLARISASLRDCPGVRVAEPAHPGVVWSSEYRIDPFDVPEPDRVGHFADASRKLLASAEIDHVLAKFTAIRERKYYADLAGTSADQTVVRVHPQFLALGGGTRLRSQGPPTARGWEYLSGQGWDWDAEFAGLPDQLAEKARARPVEPGCYDLVIDPSNLWLTIHETVGHATELDRALGHEASYAGTTFVTPGDVGSLRYGSPLMAVTADRTTPHGLATTAIDDEGVAAQSWPLISDGILAGLQTGRATAPAVGARRSTGCAFAESAEHAALQRMPNVSLRPAPEGGNTEDLIAGVTDGIYLTGAESWSIDMRRENFQFTPQRAYRIRSGRLAGQLAGVAYQGRTTEFWRALSALGGPATWQVFGADLCGKGLPTQAAATSHGTPAAVFDGVRVLDIAEGGPG